MVLESRSVVQVRATALHEAGHAVVAWDQRIRIDSVSVIPDENSEGRVLHDHGMAGYNPDSDNSPQVRIRLEKRIRVALAGPIAQRKFARRSWRQVHGETDYRDAADLVLRMVESGKQADEYIRRLEIETDLIVIKWGRMIQSLAAKLVRQRTMKGREIKVFIIRGMKASSIGTRDEKPRIEKRSLTR